MSRAGGATFGMVRLRAFSRSLVHGTRRALPIQRSENDIRLTVPVQDDDPMEREENREASVTTFYLVLER